MPCSHSYDHNNLYANRLMWSSDYPGTLYCPDCSKRFTLTEWLPKGGGEGKEKATVRLSCQACKEGLVHCCGCFSFPTRPCNDLEHCRCQCHGEKPTGDNGGEVEWKPGLGKVPIRYIKESTGDNGGEGLRLFYTTKEIDERFRAVLELFENYSLTHAHLQPRAKKFIDDFRTRFLP